MTILTLQKHENDLHFRFKLGDTEVAIWMPYATLLETVPDSGDLHSQVEKYVERMMNLGDLMG